MIIPFNLYILSSTLSHSNHLGLASGFSDASSCRWSRDQPFAFAIRILVAIFWRDLAHGGNARWSVQGVGLAVGDSTDRRHRLGAEMDEVKVNTDGNILQAHFLCCHPYQHSFY
jgi:hypothetical protein